MRLILRPRLHHNTTEKLRSLLFARSAWVLEHPLLTVAKRMQKTGPMVHRPYPLVDVIVKAAYSPQFF